MQGFNNSLIPFYHKLKKTVGPDLGPGQFLVSDFFKSASTSVLPIL